MVFSERESNITIIIGIIIKVISCEDGHIIVHVAVHDEHAMLVSARVHESARRIADVKHRRHAPRHNTCPHEFSYAHRHGTHHSTHGTHARHAQAHTHAALSRRHVGREERLERLLCAARRHIDAIGHAPATLQPGIARITRPPAVHFLAGWPAFQTRLNVLTVEDRL